MLRKQGNHCWFAFVLWCGYRSLSFQSFVLRHLLITKKLPFFLRATRECPVTRLHRGKNMVKNGVKRQTNNNKKNFGEQREPSCRLRRTRARLASLADFFRLFLNCGTWSQANLHVAITHAQYVFQRGSFLPCAHLALRQPYFFRFTFEAKEIISL